MRALTVLGALWVGIFVVVPLLWQRRPRKVEASLATEMMPDVDVGPVAVQILFAQVFPDHVRVDCMQLADTGAHEAGYPLTLRIARPEHPALDGTMTGTLAELAESLAEVELRFAVRRGDPQVRIARNRTAMTFDLGAAA